MVKCADCGFLAFRLHNEWAFVDADVDYRQTGVARSTLVGVHACCFMRQFDLVAEMAAIGKNPRNDLWSDATISVLNRERLCNAHTAWHQGFTPKEHREMMDRQWMLDREDRRDRVQRRWRLAEFAAVLVGVVMVVVAAFIERGGQPTINVQPPTVQPSTPDTPAVPP